MVTTIGVTISTYKMSMKSYPDFTEQVTTVDVDALKLTIAPKNAVTIVYTDGKSKSKTKGTTLII